MKEREEKVKRSADQQKKGRKDRVVLGEKKEGSINLFAVDSFCLFCSRWQLMCGRFYREIKICVHYRLGVVRFLKMFLKKLFCSLNIFKKKKKKCQIVAF